MIRVWRFLPLFLLAAVTACTRPEPVPETPAPEEPAQELVEVSFSYLPGWPEDHQTEALKAFRLSCAQILKQPPDRALGEKNGSGGIAGRVGDWREPCEAARTVPLRDSAVRAFFEHYFVPWLATDRGNPDGLFTGYYEAELKGSWTRTARHIYPIYARPKDLIDVDLGAFRADLKGRRLAGRLRGNKLVPYADRATIEGGALAGKGLELLWVDSATDAFFLHVQGSGRVRMTDGSVVRLGFAGRNGHSYTSIGRVMIERGLIAREKMSMRAIRDWVSAHPRAGMALLAENDSFIFFSVLKRRAGGPVGAQGIPLTAGRSLAVDRRFVPLGVPVWLETTDPIRLGAPLRRLMVAQDTGGAIKGPVRGDYFWGFGKEAATAAGAMSQRGRAYLLLPSGVRPGTGTE